MKKCFILLSFFVLPICMFSEVVFIPHIGNVIDNNKFVRHFSSMSTLGLDIQFISHNSGFTFFLNNAVSKANKDSFFFTSEILLGHTFRREKAFNINVGFGFRNSSTINSFLYIFNVENMIPNEPILILPSFGGSFGVSYYFNNVFGLSFAVSDFVSYGAFVLDEHGREIVFSKHITDTFCFKFGLNLRINGHKKNYIKQANTDNKESSKNISASKVDQNNTNDLDKVESINKEILKELKLLNTNIQNYIKYLMFIECVKTHQNTKSINDNSHNSNLEIKKNESMIEDKEQTSNSNINDKKR